MTMQMMQIRRIGTSEVRLDGRRDFIRTQETNEGNLIADALLFQATALATTFNTPVPDVALQNGGGIRNDTIIPAGNLSELDTFSILPFANFVSIVPSIPAAQFKEILENAVSRVEFIDGRFAQISGFRMVWDPSGTAQVLDENGNVTTPGTRVRSVMLDNSTVIVEDGVIVAGAPAVNIATIDFSARGGDQYPFRGASFTTLGVTYQQALVNYIQQELGGTIREAEYPEGGERRITSPGVQVSVETR
jgi:5'-nucleotidase / UDP-sugar diphosphatase